MSENKTTPTPDTAVHASVKNYYGKVLKKSDDLKTNACCTSGGPPPLIRDIIKQLHPETVEKYYGCGIVVPDELTGLSVLDLGSGAGRDVYIIAKLVGENGRVCGIDMTEEQIDAANRHKEFHAKAFGYANVEFRHGYIENLAAAGLEDNSFDLIVSNCVVNLSPDKEAVLREAYRVLKPGGEMYFSDVYSDRRIPQHLVEHEMLFGECLSGALYWNDFERLAQKVGFTDPRLVTDSPITIQSKEAEDLVNPIKFYSATYRLFKLPGELSPDCEDFGQAVVYKGSVAGKEQALTLDAHHVFPKGKVFPVCGNTLAMVTKTRFQRHFDVFGDGQTHYGIFDGCGRGIPFASAKGDGASAGGGCC